MDEDYTAEHKENSGQTCILKALVLFFIFMVTLIAAAMYQNLQEKEYIVNAIKNGVDPIAARCALEKDALTSNMCIQRAVSVAR